MLDLMFHFQHMAADCFLVDWIGLPFSLKKMKRAFSRWQREMFGIGWNALYLENHDHPRIIDRYGSREYRVESGKMLAAMYICQCGTPFVYQGQEIGMTNIKLDGFDKFKDVITFNNYRLFKKLRLSDERILKITNRSTRENARTPMQWSGGENAGFTTGDPWFHINPNHTEINVEAAEKDADSILHFYRAALKFRKENEIVIYGDYKEHYKESRKLYVYERSLGEKRLLVICSFSDKPVRFITPKGFNLKNGRLVLQNYKSVTESNVFLTRPYETRVYLFEN